MTEQTTSIAERMIDSEQVPFMCEEARRLLAEGKLVNKTTAEQTYLALVERVGEPIATGTFTIAFTIARQVNSTLLSASSPFGSALRNELKFFGGESTPAYVERIERQVSQSDYQAAA